MADSKITALTSISTSTDPANDPLVIVDVSDTSMAASGTTKKVTLNQLLGAGGTATLASATITGDLTVDTSTLKVDSANDRVGIGIATPAWPLDIRSATAIAQILSTTGTNAAYLQVSNTGGFFYLGRENSAGTSFASPAYSAVLYAGGAYPLVTTVNGSERYRIASDGVATWSNVGGVAGTAMTLNSTGLGIGVSPSNNLHVQGASGATAIRISAVTAGPLGFIGSASGLISGSPANNLAVRAENGLYLSGGGNATQFILNSSGNLGLGVTPSAWGLGSSGYRAFEIGAIGNSIFSATNDLNISSNAYYLAGWKYGASSYASQYSQGSGKHIWYTAPSGTAGNAITFTQAMTLDASGRLLVGPTSANASGGVLQLSSGITFPATQVASSDANTLDDYEEGNWTPTDASGAGLTFTVSNCRYTKVGRLVTVQGSITYPATANGSNATWGGFPFNSSDSFNLGIVYTDVAVSSLTYISSNGVNAFLLTPGVNVINSTVSGKTIAFYGTYMI